MCRLLESFLSQVTFGGRVRFRGEDKYDTQGSFPTVLASRQENFPSKPHGWSFFFQSQVFLPSALSDPRKWMPSPCVIQLPIAFLFFSLYFQSGSMGWPGGTRPPGLGRTSQDATEGWQCPALG